MDEAGNSDPIQLKIVELMWEAQNGKTASIYAPSVARRWAVFYTELEKILAYYQTFLQPKLEEKSDA